MAWGEAYDRCRWRNYKFNYRTKAAVMELESRLGVPVTVLQGSYNAGAVGASGGTHDGGGAVDIMVWGLDPRVVENRARRIGFALWHRPKLVVNGKLIWDEHYHGILMADKEMSPAAKWQIDEYLNTPGGDGLTGNNADANQFHPVKFFKYKAWLRKRTLRNRIASATRRIQGLSSKRRKYQKEFKSISVTA